MASLVNSFWGGAAVASYDIRNIGSEEFAVNNTFDGAGFDRKSGVFFKPDGSKMFFSDDTNTFSEYGLSPVFDISTNSLNTTETGAGTFLKGIQLNDDGTKVYLCRTNGLVYEYDLSTAYDLTSQSLVGNFDSLLAAQGLWWKPDGSALFTIHSTKIKKWTAATNFLISGITYDSEYSYSGAIVPSATGGAFSPNGEFLYIAAANASQGIIQYTLSTGFDLSTVTYDTNKVLSATMDCTYVSDGFRFVTLSNSATLRMRVYEWT